MSQIGAKRLTKTIKNVIMFHTSCGTLFSCHGKVPNLDFCNTFHTQTWFLRCDQVDMLSHFGSRFRAKMHSRLVLKLTPKPADFSMRFFMAFGRIMGPDMPHKSDQKNSKDRCAKITSGNRLEITKNQRNSSQGGRQKYLSDKTWD